MQDFAGGILNLKLKFRQIIKGENMKNIALNNGKTMPALGFGVFLSQRSRPKKQCLMPLAQDTA